MVWEVSPVSTVSVSVEVVDVVAVPVVDVTVVDDVTEVVVVVLLLVVGSVAVSSPQPASKTSKSVHIYINGIISDQSKFIDHLLGSPQGIKHGKKSVFVAKNRP